MSADVVTFVPKQQPKAPASDAPDLKSDAIRGRHVELAYLYWRRSPAFDVIAAALDEAYITEKGREKGGA